VSLPPLVVERGAHNRCVRERRGQSEIVLMRSQWTPLFVYALTFRNPGISDMPVGSSALPPSDTTRPSVKPLGGGA